MGLVATSCVPVLVLARPDNRLEHLRNMGWLIVLPDANHAPTGRLETSSCLIITPAVLVDLALPKVTVRL